MAWDECKKSLEDTIGNASTWDANFLGPVSNREFLSRIIRNLQSIYLRNSDHVRAFKMIEFSLTLNPDSLLDRRDRGIVQYCLGNSAEALGDLQYYLDFSPRGPDTERVHQMVSELRIFLDD